MVLPHPLRFSRPRHLRRSGAAAGHSLALVLVAVAGIAALGAVGAAWEGAIAGQAAGRSVTAAIAPSVSGEAASSILARVVRRAAETSEAIRRTPRPSAPIREHWLPPSAVSAEALAEGVPTRFVVAPGARAKHGALLDSLADGLTRGDELADAVVDAMRPLDRAAQHKLIDHVLSTRRIPAGTSPELEAALDAFLLSAERIPHWVDLDAVNRGADVMARSGAAGLATLMSYSLPLTYTSPAGVKPLAWTKDLLEATPRRLAETMDFIHRTATPNSLVPGADGWKTTLRVRLIHASVRSALRRMPHWDEAAWGVPINQTEMLGTNVAFSSVFMDGMERLGFRYTPREKEDMVALWRYAGYLMGVEEKRLARTDAEGRRIVSAIGATQAPPDADSRALIHALLGVSIMPNPPPAFRAANAALTRFMLGDHYADLLSIPAGGPLDAIRALLPSTSRAMDLARRRTPGGEAMAVRAGRALWDRVVRTTLGRTPAEFLIPERGRGVRSATTSTGIGH